MSEITNKVIALDYKLTKDNESGQLFETTEGNKPMAFITGVGMMIPDFEKNVSDIKVGDSFSFGIPSDKAYGERQDDAIMDLPKSTFIHEGELIPDLKVGNTIGLQDDKGNPFPAVVLEIADETVKMDLNHPLAGQNLHFSGKIVESRLATQEELKHGHVHGEHGHQH